jgi:hypothetical protein
MNFIEMVDQWLRLPSKIPDDKEAVALTHARFVSRDRLALSCPCYA